MRKKYFLPKKTFPKNEIEEVGDEKEQTNERVDKTFSN